jgi:tRNA-binding protein
MVNKNERNLSWNEFMNVEMRVGTIIHAEVFEEARNSAYKIHVDFGEYGIRKTSAQITKLYSPDEIIGKQVIAVINFPVKQIATFMSECLILGAIGDDKEVILIAPDRKIKNGLRIG